MLQDEKHNGEEKDRDYETQKMFEEGMPDSIESNAIPSSLDIIADSDQESDQLPEENGSETNTDYSEDNKLETLPTKTRGITSVEGKLSSEAHSHIKGWGIDADPSNDPTYPIKSRTNEEQLGNTWQRPTLQEQNVELLMSVERNSLPAVFSNENPPKGISGALKRKAFQYSESDYRHWLALVASDKIGVLEGKIDDLKHGHIPNPIEERGLKSEWQYNRVEFVKKSAIKVAITGAAIGLILLSRKKK